jgi:hypothetical protein
MPSNEPTMQGLKPLSKNALKFCNLVVKGDRPVQAYVTAFRPGENAKKTSIHSAAARMMGDPRVKRHIDALKRKSEKALLEESIALRDWTLARLKEEASDRDSPPASRVSALGILARASKLVESGSAQVNVNVANVVRPSAEVEQELVARLSALASVSHVEEAEVIEGDFEEVEDDSEEDAESPEGAE